VPNLDLDGRKFLLAFGKEHRQEFSSYLAASQDPCGWLGPSLEGKRPLVTVFARRPTRSRPAPPRLVFISQSFSGSQRRAPRHPARGLLPFQGKWTNKSVDAAMKHGLIEARSNIVNILVWPGNFP
jgi:hypothetical protein